MKTLFSHGILKKTNGSKENQILQLINHTFAYHFCVPNPLKPPQPPLSPSLLTPHQQQDKSLFTFDTSLSFPLLVISHFRFLNDIWVSFRNLKCEWLVLI
ncbi:hypothetical protein NC653_037659 [Populus alba x Populus x berolinensis]|uniref:Uncharacterized protein n=1 Tax=Populus alba x Populus x berolinensis TaxID=444605 RepID=A0AAD6LEV3_9ROSI|nr:hypothetical protein NC653_037659 [Populus alba x Populus x berolinensis]